MQWYATFVQRVATHYPDKYWVDARKFNRSTLTRQSKLRQIDTIGIRHGVPKIYSPVTNLRRRTCNGRYVYIRTCYIPLRCILRIRSFRWRGHIYLILRRLILRIYKQALYVYIHTNPRKRTQALHVYIRTNPRIRTHAHHVDCKNDLRIRIQAHHVYINKKSRRRKKALHVHVRTNPRIRKHAQHVDIHHNLRIRT